MVWTRWEKLVKPKINGGIGVRDLECFNKALLGKWAWKAVTGGEDLWLQIVLSCLGRRSIRPSDFDCLRRQRLRLRWWEDVMKCLQDSKGNWFESNLKRVVGNGEDTLFWSDIWTGDESLKSFFSRFFSRSLNKDCSVAQAGAWEGNRWIWKVDWRTEFREADAQLLSNLVSLVECRKHHLYDSDFWKWEPEKSGDYSVRSSYNLLISRKCELDQNIENMCNLLWKNVAAAKAKATAWRILFRQIATKTELRRRGVLPQNAATGCVLCRNSEEGVDHLFLDCKKVGEIWADCLKWIGVQTALMNSVEYNFVQFCSLVRGKSKRKFLATLWVCVVWSVWKARNDIIFRDGEWKKDKVFGEIKSFMWVWAKNLKALSTPVTSFSDWSLCPWLPP